MHLLLDAGREKEIVARLSSALPLWLQCHSKLQRQRTLAARELASAATATAAAEAREMTVAADGHIYVRSSNNDSEPSRDRMSNDNNHDNNNNNNSNYVSTCSHTLPSRAPRACARAFEHQRPQSHRYISMSMMLSPPLLCSLSMPFSSTSCCTPSCSSILFISFP